MQEGLKNSFTEKWKKYFGAESLPIAFFYADESGAAAVKPDAGFLEES